MNENKTLIRMIVAAAIVLAILVGIIVYVLISDGTIGDGEANKKSQIGDTMTFGHYEQDNDPTNGAEPIQWIVLDEKDGKLLLVSKYALDYREYHNTNDEDVTWQTCAVRQWLNEEFIDTAFTSQEQEHILQVTNENHDERGREEYDGLDTQDSVFLLSADEANEYFSSDEERQCQPTDHVVAEGGWKNEDGNCWWILRSVHNNQFYAYGVSVWGDVDYFGMAAGSDGKNAIRPAMWIEIE